MGFDPAANQITFINAIGGSADFTFHKKKESSGIYLLELDYPTCVCDVAADQGTIGGFSWGSQRCTPKPLGEMLDDPVWLVGPQANPVKGKGVNPSCDIHAYRGGLRCCKGDVFRNSRMPMHRQMAQGNFVILNSQI